jgi:hypothetical protein
MREFIYELANFLVRGLSPLLFWRWRGNGESWFRPIKLLKMDLSALERLLEGREDDIV